MIIRSNLIRGLRWMGLPFALALVLWGQGVPPLDLTTGAQQVKNTSKGAADLVARDILGDGASSSLGPDGSIAFGYDLTHAPKSIPVFVVQTADLLNYKGADRPSKIMKDEEILYPLFDKNNELKASVLMYKKDGEWRRGVSGSTHLLDTIVGQIVKSSTQSKVDPTKYFAVQVPALNQYFVAFENDHKLSMIPIQSDPRLKIKYGEVYEGKDLLAKIGTFLAASATAKH